MINQQAARMEIGSELERRHSEETLKDRYADFTAKYLAVWHLQYLAETKPHLITPETIASLEALLQDEAVKHQTQAYFMYKAIGNALCATLIHAERLTERVLVALRDVLGKIHGTGHRAIAEACGSLPVAIRGPAIGLDTSEECPALSWSQLTQETGLAQEETVRREGRSLVVEGCEEAAVMVFKMARAGEPAESLYREAAWMEYFAGLEHDFPIRFDIPRIRRVKDARVFRMSGACDAWHEISGLHPARYAIAFQVHPDYFCYPNETKGLCGREFRETMLRNAWLLGRLTSLGIVHAAPISLFHNRAQAPRRGDQGLYEWVRGGRLDQWLNSCAFPNLGRSGIRDFEHFVSFEGSSLELYRHMGRHFLSLLLVIGSWFRNKDPQRVGIDHHGNPIDARDLFEKRPLRDLIEGLFLHYYQGFVGRAFVGGIPVHLDQLCARMIEEMGVDRHMEEILRVTDQRRMTESDFRRYLFDQGFDEGTISSIKKGARDIRILSGPHLGGFNERISLPELIEAVGTMSALCVLGRYLHRRGRDFSLMLLATAD